MTDTADSPGGLKAGSEPAALRVAGLKGMIVGAILLAACGAAFGAFLHFFPDYKWTVIRARLRAPHPDSRRFTASAYAILYEDLGTIAGRRALDGVVLGMPIGAIGGTVVALIRTRRRNPAVGRPALGQAFSVAVEMLIVWWVVGIGYAFLEEKLLGQEGCVYCEGRDQFYWIDQLESPTSPRRSQAITALCDLLRSHRHYPCQLATMEALGKCGPEAREAVPVLQTLARADDAETREGARRALAMIAP